MAARTDVSLASILGLARLQNGNKIIMPVDESLQGMNGCRGFQRCREIVMLQVQG